MNQSNGSKRREGATAVKALIGAAAVAATVAGWALLPANDPPTAAAATGPTGGPPELSVPGSTQPGPSTGLTDIQPINPQTTLPQVTTPRGFTQQPFTRSHSSR
jgi:hypothetical protein